jgi:hypothetical protein
VVAITILSTLLLMVDYYERLTPLKAIDRVALYLLIPLGVILLAFRKSPREYGFTFGDWRAGFALTAIIIAIAAPILWFIAAFGFLHLFHLWIRQHCNEKEEIRGRVDDHWTPDTV